MFNPFQPPQMQQPPRPPMQPPPRPPMQPMPSAPPQAAPMPPVGGNVQQIIGNMTKLPTPALVAATKDPTVGYLALVELKARNERAKQANPTPMPPPTSIAQREASEAAKRESSGLMSLAAPPQQFSRGGPVRFSGGGTTGMSPHDVYRALDPVDQFEFDKKLRELVSDVNRGISPRDAWSIVAKEYEPIVKQRELDSQPKVNPFYRNEGTTGTGADLLAALQTTRMPITASSAQAKYPYDGGMDQPPPPPAPRVSSGGGSASVRVPGIGGLPQVRGPSVQMGTNPLGPGGLEALMKQVAEARAAQEKLLPPGAQSPQERLAAAQEQLKMFEQLNPMDPGVAEYKNALAQRMAQLKNSQASNESNAWLRFGLEALKGGGGRYFGPGVSNAGIAALDAYQSAQQRDQQGIDALLGKQFDLSKFNMQHRQGNVNAALEAAKAARAEDDARRQAQFGMAGQRIQDAQIPIGYAEKQAAVDKSQSDAYFNAARAANIPIENALKSRELDIRAVSASAEAARATAYKAYVTDSRTATHVAQIENAATAAFKTREGVLAARDKALDADIRIKNDPEAYLAAKKALAVEQAELEVAKRRQALAMAPPEIRPYMETTLKVAEDALAAVKTGSGMKGGGDNFGDAPGMDRGYRR